MKSVFLFACVAAAFAQSPSFELASIKPSDPAAAISIRRSGHRIATTSTSLEFLITWAYDIRNDRLAGKPGWLDSVRYDVVASAGEDDRPSPPRRPGQPTELQQMMQTLLGERFKLVIHRETRELQVYALVMAKGGARVHLTEAPDVMGQSPFNMPGAGRLTGTQVSAAMLANVLSGQLNRTVQDQTGLQGVFDFKLEWEPDPLAGNLFTAIQEQLGLKLEARKGPVEVVVIDHIERVPSAN
jgi:uncharacterized protein (TIGR03435 family)